jgi:hypothetical protein
LHREVEGDLHAVLMASLDQPAEVLKRPEFGMFRVLLESKPVSPAPEAGGVNTAEAGACAKGARFDCWKRGGLRGSDCKLGASGSG